MMSYIVSNSIIMRVFAIWCSPDRLDSKKVMCRICSSLFMRTILKCKYFSPVVTESRGSNPYQMYVLLNAACHYAAMTALTSLVRQGFQVLTVIKKKEKVLLVSISCTNLPHLNPYIFLVYCQQEMVILLNTEPRVGLYGCVKRICSEIIGS